MGARTLAGAGGTPRIDRVPARDRPPESTPLLEVDDLHAEPLGDGAPAILRGVNLSISAGSCHVLMGPNGSGKSTLANVLLGHPGYRITEGRIRLRGEDITHWSADARAKAGMFLAFQSPKAVEGVSVVQFLRQAVSARKGTEISALEIRFALSEWMERLGMDPAFAERHLNEGFSGGERKRNEILQMALLEPDLAVLDETDSGLDVDALRTVGRGIEEVCVTRPEMGLLVITHYMRILDSISCDEVHLLLGGRIAASGGPELAEKLERDGFEAWQ